MKTSQKYWWLVLIKGIILIVLSFYVFQHPVSALVGLAIYVGISLLITGISLIIAALAFRKDTDNWGWRLAEGIIDVLFAFILLNNPGVTAAVFPFIVGFCIIVYGVIFIADSFNDKKAGVGNWWMGLVGGIIGIIVGYFITNNPMEGAFTVTIWIGLGFLLLGIVNVILSFSMRKVGKVIES